MHEITGFGSRVIGEKAALMESDMLHTASHIYGERVVGARPESPDDEPLPSGVETPTFLDQLGVNTAQKLQRIKTVLALEELLADELAGKNREPIIEAIELRRVEIEQQGALTVVDLKAALSANPKFLDEAIVREFNRPRVRKEAVRTFIEIEVSRDSGPRADVLDRLEKALG
jgi:hypothetical protein